MPYGTVDYSSLFPCDDDGPRDDYDPETMRPEEIYRAMDKMAGEIADFIVTLGNKCIGKGVFSRKMLISWLSDYILFEAAHAYIENAKEE